LYGVPSGNLGFVHAGFPFRHCNNDHSRAHWRRAIAEAIKRHNVDKPEREHIPHWHPHQLRHTRALEVKRDSGLDVARAVLGHKTPSVTEMYAGLDVAKAAEVIGRIG
jgi:integrase